METLKITRFVMSPDSSLTIDPSVNLTSLDKFEIDQLIENYNFTFINQHLLFPAKLEIIKCLLIKDSQCYVTRLDPTHTEIAQGHKLLYMLIFKSEEKISISHSEKIIEVNTSFYNGEYSFVFQIQKD